MQHWERVRAKYEYKLMKHNLMGGGDCKKSTLAKYTKRPSPPYPANDCVNRTMRGNDGNMWTSKAGDKSTARWYPAASKSQKAAKQEGPKDDVKKCMTFLKTCVKDMQAGKSLTAKREREMEKCEKVVQAFVDSKPTTKPKAAKFDRELTAAEKQKIKRVLKMTDESFDMSLTEEMDDDAFMNKEEIYITKGDLDDVLAGRKKFYVVEPQWYNSISILDLNNESIEMHQQFIEVDGRGTFYTLNKGKGGSNAVVGTGSGFDRYLKITDQFMKTIDRLSKKRR